jgi:hypothetical protein
MLDFCLPHRERAYLLERIESAQRIAPGSHGEESLLSRLAKAHKRPKCWIEAGYGSTFVRSLADSADREALRTAFAASALAHIGRATYNALVERMGGTDGQSTSGQATRELKEIVWRRREIALECNLNEVEGFIGPLDGKFRRALGATLDSLRSGSIDLSAMWKPYCESEQHRKGARARLVRTPHAKTLRAMWLANRETHAEPLNYRWHRVGQLLNDLQNLDG